MTGKSRVVTFRMDQETWEFMRELVRYTKYRKASSFIREGIKLLLKQEEEQPTGWTVRPTAKAVRERAARRDRGPRHFCRSPMPVGLAVRPSGARPFDGTIGG